MPSAVIGELARRLPEYLAGNRRLYHRLGKERGADELVLDAIARLRGRGRSPELWPTEIVDPATVLHEMRAIKSAEEIARMQRAAEITGEGHVGAMRLAAPGRHEYEIEALLREIDASFASDARPMSVAAARGLDRLLDSPVQVVDLSLAILTGELPVFAPRKSPVVEVE